jgi:uncharacterized protein YbjT (DUF2867 family)
MRSPALKWSSTWPTRPHSKIKLRWTSSRRPARTSLRRKWPPASSITLPSRFGTERLLDSGYFRAKLAQEKLIKNAPIPYTIVRATQFFEFLRGIAQSAIEGDTVRLSHSLFQPMAAEDVATAVAEAAVAEPINGTIEIAGPDAFHIDEIVGKVLEYDKDARKVVVDPEALYFGVKLNDQSLVPGPNARRGSTKFDWWLTHVPPPPPKK